MKVFRLSPAVQGYYGALVQAARDAAYFLPQVGNVSLMSDLNNVASRVPAPVGSSDPDEAAFITNVLNPLRAALISALSFRTQLVAAGAASAAASYFDSSSGSWVTPPTPTMYDSGAFYNNP